MARIPTLKDVALQVKASVKLILVVMVCAIGLLAQPVFGQVIKSPRIFLIGNSLTNDTVPSALEGTVKWHIDCGKNLQFIFDHPQAPCLKSSTLWTTALKENEFDVLVVQPFSGTTLEQDSVVISEWMRLQPKARVVLHTGWPKHADLKSSFHAAWNETSMQYTPRYFRALRDQLESRNPGRSVTTTAALPLLDAISHDIDAGEAPFKELKELYRDDIHMELQSGRYLMHNAMRIALGQPISSQGFLLEPSVRTYLDAKLNALRR